MLSVFKPQICHHFFPGPFFRTVCDQGFFFFIMRGNMRVVMRGILVTAVHVVIHIFQHNAKISAGGVKLRAQILGVAGKLFRLADDLPQTTATALHEFHAVEQIGNDRIAAHGADRVMLQSWIGLPSNMPPGDWISSRSSYMSMWISLPRTM